VLNILKTNGMLANWKEKLQKESNQRLFEIFSETERINIEPQIYCGNLLFDRNYDIGDLRKAKHNLINSIENSFKNRYTLDRKKNNRENTIRELTLRIILGLIIITIFYFAPEFDFKFGNLIIGSKIIAFVLITLNFLPLLRIKKSNEKSIKRAELENEKKNKQIVKINTELRF
jgi:hypothetical protein